eukprot:8181-Heterococcus_DN1.PRE.1
MYNSTRGAVGQHTEPLARTLYVCQNTRTTRCTVQRGTVAAVHAGACTHMAYMIAPDTCAKIQVDDNRIEQLVRARLTCHLCVGNGAHIAQHCNASILARAKCAAITTAYCAGVRIALCMCLATLTQRDVQLSVGLVRQLTNTHTAVKRA